MWWAGGRMLLGEPLGGQEVCPYMCKRLAIFIHGQPRMRLTEETILSLGGLVN